MRQKRPNIGQISKYQKTPMQSRKYHWFPGICQFLAPSDPPAAQKTGCRGNFFTHFAPFSYTNGQNRARSAQLRRVISWEPLRVGRQMSPFWKGDNQGYNIGQNKKK